MLLPFGTLHHKEREDGDAEEGCCCKLISSLKHTLTYYLSIAAAGVVGIGFAAHLRAAACQ